MAGIERAHALVATTSSDKANLLCCQIARTHFGLSKLVARANSEGSMRTFSEMGIRAMSPNAAAVLVLDNLLRRPSTLRLLTDLDAGKEVRETVLRNGTLAGRALKDLRLEGDVLIAMIRRDSRLFVPHGATVLQRADQLTLIGASDDVTSAAALFERPQQDREPAGQPAAAQTKRG
ncbi:MAG: hypothetical protein OHK0022_08570 [Roseiflexaceae bacterium]